MAKVPLFTLREEAIRSSAFHREMLRQLEIHHDEKAGEWTPKLVPFLMQEVKRHTERYFICSEENHPRSRHLVHAANFLSIVWSIEDANPSGD